MTATGRPGNFPAELTGFVGRVGELATVTQSLESRRLVSITGDGGMGKSRLAMRVAAAVHRSFADGAWFVELADATSSDVVATLVAQQLSLDPGTEPAAAVVNHLTNQSALVILDNCEQVLAGAATLAEQILRQCPRVRVLATSREVLSIGGEVDVNLRGLSTSDPAHLPEAVELFAQRAALRSDFAITTTNVAAITKICQLLDGSPLAIELASGRLSALSVHQLLEQLERDPLRMLSGPARRWPERHRSIRLSLDWSWRLCDPTERWLWAALSVFSADFALDGVEAICEDEDFDPLDALQSLVVKSIVVAEPTEAGMSFRLLDTSRLFGAQRLAETEDGAMIADRHQEFSRSLSATTIIGDHTGSPALTNCASSRHAATLFTYAPRPAEVCALTDREEQIIELLAQGWSNRQIAAELFIAVRTAEGHVAQIFKKLGVCNRTEAVALGSRRLRQKAAA